MLLNGELLLSFFLLLRYRAHECRNNAHWLKDGRVVYHVAAVGIVCDPQTLRQEHYLHHTDDILCLAVHPGGELVASGQASEFGENYYHITGTLKEAFSFPDSFMITRDWHDVS